MRKGTAKKKPNIEVGQTIYVSTVEHYRDHEPNLLEYEVKKVNTVSIYAAPKGMEVRESLWNRFEKRTMTAEGFIGRKYAYTDPEDYWRKVRNTDRKNELRKEISASLPKLKLEQLERIYKIIK